MRGVDLGWCCLMGCEIGVTGYGRPYHQIPIQIIGTDYASAVLREVAGEIDRSFMEMK